MDGHRFFFSNRGKSIIDGQIVAKEYQGVIEYEKESESCNKFFGGSSHVDHAEHDNKSSRT